MKANSENNKKVLTKTSKIAILAEFKEEQELKRAADKRVAELKAQIKEYIEAGVYGDYVLTFEEREVKEYVVRARVDEIVKVNKI